jgi:hypothetical protein
MIGPILSLPSGRASQCPNCEKWSLIDGATVDIKCDRCTTTFQAVDMTCSQWDNWKLSPGTYRLPTLGAPIGTRAAETTVDILQARLNVMRGVALVGWVGMVLLLMGV